MAKRCFADPESHEQNNLASMLAGKHCQRQAGTNEDPNLGLELQRCVAVSIGPEVLAKPSRGRATRQTPLPAKPSITLSM